jgi:3-deoxy-D-manno-octulosonate 8-phosphate phosphatase (KDO 8-P phosphatase)
MNLEERCRNIELILADVDGVLTDGGIIYDNQGIEIKRFHSRDGFGIKLWRRAGFHFGILTARTSHIVKIRAAELGIDVLRQGFEDKWPAARDVFAEWKLTPKQVAYIGDDLPDLAVMRHIGLPIAVADACNEVRDSAAYVTAIRGGQGAVREAIELILKAKGLWEDVVAHCIGG